MDGQSFAGFVATEVMGVPVLYRHDSRFKTFRVSWTSERPLDDAAAARSLLPSLLLQGTVRDPDRPSLMRRMEMLYAASAAPSTSKVGENHRLRLALDSVAGGYLPERPDLFGAGLSLLADIVARPCLDHGGFPAEAFERERLLARNEVLAEFDDKGSYAWHRALALACAGEPMAIPEHGGLERIDALTAASPEQARQDFLQHGRHCVLAMGVLPEPLALIEAVQVFLAELPVTSRPPQRCSRSVPPRPTRATVERAEMQQSKLVLIQRLPIEVDPRAWVARRLFVSMLGGGVHSRLFREIREKQSLAYYASAGLDRHTGLLSVNVGLNEDVAARVTDAIIEQIADLRAGNFTTDELQTARAGLLSAIATVDDSIGAAMGFAEDQWGLQLDRTPADLAGLYAEVQAEEICASVEGLWFDFSYLLAPDPSTSTAETPTAETPTAEGDV